MIIVLGLLNNISYGPQSGGNFVLRGVGSLQFIKKLLLFERGFAVMPNFSDK